MVAVAALVIMVIPCVEQLTVVAMAEMQMVGFLLGMVIQELVAAEVVAPAKQEMEAQVLLLLDT